MCRQQQWSRKAKSKPISLLNGNETNSKLESMFDDVHEGNDTEQFLSANFASEVSQI